MLVVNRFIVAADAADAREFPDRATATLRLLAGRPGYVRGELGRAYDDPTHWTMVTVWESVGAYRRALGAYDVKMQATPLFAWSVDEPSAYEVLASASPDGTVTTAASDRAEDLPSTLRSRP
jgi:heme oxygenase (mycobilin-producing)